MTMPAVRFHRDADEDTWTWVMERLVDTTVRVSCTDGTVYEGEISDAANGVLHLHILRRDDLVQAAVPVEMIKTVTVL